MATKLDTRAVELDQQGVILRQIAACGYCGVEELSQLRQHLPQTFQRLQDYHTGIGELRGLRQLAEEKLLPAHFIAMFL